MFDNRELVSLGVGQELSIFNRSGVHDTELIGRRKGTSWAIGSQTYRHSDISLPSLLHNNSLVRMLRTSNLKDDVDLSRKLMKMAASLGIINSSRGAFDQ